MRLDFRHVGPCAVFDVSQILSEIYAHSREKTGFFLDGQVSRGVRDSKYRFFSGIPEDEPKAARIWSLGVSFDLSSLLGGCPVMFGGSGPPKSGGIDETPYYTTPATVG